MKPDTPDRAPTMKRRTFVGAAALTALSYRHVIGANERIGVGFIGFGLIGKRHLLDFKEQPDVAIAAIAEAHSGRMDEGAALAGTPVRKFADFRKLLECPDVDAVVISTPDHWHALMTMLACAAGKDVYVEKPLTLFVREGRWMVELARRSERVVQVGTQQRSGPHYQQARELIRKGHVGKVCSVRMSAYRNVYPGFGRPADRPPPPELDWEMMLGPAPQRPYNPNRGIYHFRWFWDYSGGQMTNLGAHALDILHWFLEPAGPTAVVSAGGRFCLEDNGETPDTQDALFEYPGFTAAWSHREASQGRPGVSGLEFFGSRGSLALSRTGFEIIPDRRISPEDAIPQFAGAHPVGGPKREAESGPARYWTSAVTGPRGSAAAQLRLHVRNFLDCIKTRQQPISDLESAHRVATACHLANVSLQLGRKLRWNPATEQIVGDAEAAARLIKPYRSPWDKEWQALRLEG